MTFNFIGALVVAVFAIHLALRVRAKGVKEAISSMSGYAIVFYSVSLFATTLLPKQIATNETNIGRNWDVIIDRGADVVVQGGEAVYNATGIGIDPESQSVFVSTSVPMVTSSPSSPTRQVHDSPETGSYTVMSGDTLTSISREFSVTVQDLQIWNGLQSNAVIYAGQELIVMVSPIIEVTIPPTVIPDSITAVVPEVESSPEPISTTNPDLITQLYALKNIGDIHNGLQVIELIGLDDPVAQQEKAEIDAAVARRFSYGELAGLATSATLIDETTELVADTLRGSQYEIIHDGGERWTLVCNEWATVRDIQHGWTYGTEFEVIRCYLAELYDVIQTGDKFEAR